jgi:Tfp pilus assembly protein PilF/predicted aspartyl protease
MLAPLFPPSTTARIIPRVPPEPQAVMLKHLRSFVALILAALPLSARAEGCHLEQVLSLPLIGPSTGTPLIAATINGTPATLMVDTGGSWSFLSSTLAEGLPVEPVPDRIRFYDAADAAMNKVVTVKELGLGRQKLAKVQFLMGEMSSFGANLLHDFDVEIDPVDRKFNLFKHFSCDGAPIYWPHSELAVVPFRQEGFDQMMIEVKLDGERVEALVDTGAEMSQLDDRKARNSFDVAPASPGTEESHASVAATGAQIVEYRHQFKTLEFGGLTITHPWIRIGVHGHTFFNSGYGPPFVIGMSTLAPFHIYIAYADKKIYLTTAHGDIQAGRKPAALANDGDLLAKVNQRELLESAENALRTGNPAGARAAYDRAIALAPDDPAPLAARAYFLTSQHDMAGAKADYDRLGSMSLQNAVQYISRSGWYRRAGRFEQALADAEAAVKLAPDQEATLNLRCWTKAIMGRLDAALADCNAALALAPKAGDALDSRGFIEWKSGRLDAALADYIAAIESNPRSASSLYGRSLVERRQGKIAAADADLAAAKAIQPDIEQNFGT